MIYPVDKCYPALWTTGTRFLKQCLVTSILTNVTAVCTVFCNYIGILNLFFFFCNEAPTAVVNACPAKEKKPQLRRKQKKWGVANKTKCKRQGNSVAFKQNVMVCLWLFFFQNNIKLNIHNLNLP